MDYRGGPTQEVERAEDAQGDGEEVGWCKRGGEDNARGGARRHGRFPLQQLIN